MMKERFEANKTKVVAAVALLIGIVLGETELAEILISLVSTLAE